MNSIPRDNVDLPEALSPASASSTGRRSVLLALAASSTGRRSVLRAPAATRGAIEGTVGSTDAGRGARARGAAVAAPRARSTPLRGLRHAGFAATHPGKDSNGEGRTQLGNG